MKKLLLLITVLCASTLQAPFSNKISKLIDDSKTSTNNFDFGSESLVESFTKIEKFLSYGRWSHHEYNYEFPLYKIDVYKESHYADFSIRDIYNRMVPGNSTIDYSVTFNSEIQDSYSSTYSEVYTHFDQIKNSTIFKDNKGFNVGGYKTKLDFNFCQEKELEIIYGNEFQKAIANSISRKQNYSVSINEKFHFENTNDFNVIQSLCYREKFDVYRINLIYNVPCQKENDRGINGVDYTYNIACSSEDNFYFFVPSNEPIYIDQTTYVRNEDGNLCNINTRLENNVLYL